MDIQVEYIPLADIVEADINPKDHDIGQIYQSIKRFGFTQPIMMNENTGKLLAGHGRLQTLQQMKQGGEKVPARIKKKTDNGQFLFLKVLPLKTAEAQAYLIADNRLTELGGWNTGELVDTLQELVEVACHWTELVMTLMTKTMVTQIDDSGIFDVEVVPDADDDETSVNVTIGRYRFKVEPEDFYAWEENSRDVGLS